MAEGGWMHNISICSQNHNIKSVATKISRVLQQKWKWLWHLIEFILKSKYFYHGTVTESLLFVSCGLISHCILRKSEPTCGSPIYSPQPQTNWKHLNFYKHNTPVFYYKAENLSGLLCTMRQTARRPDTYQWCALSLWQSHGAKILYYNHLNLLPQH